MNEPLLDGDLLRQLRLQADLSRRRLARLTGLAAGIIDRLESNRSHSDLTLRKLHRLADALATTPTSLFRRDPVEPAADDLKVEAALVSSPTYLRTEELSRGLGWKLRRTHAALRELRSRLQTTGQDLRRTSNGYALVARLETLSRAERQDLERARSARRGINITAARLLYRLYRASGDNGFERLLGNAERVALGTLLKAGLAERRGRTFAISATVRSALAGSACGQAWVPRYMRLVATFPLTVTSKVQKFKMHELEIQERNLTSSAAARAA